MVSVKFLQRISLFIAAIIENFNQIQTDGRQKCEQIYDFVIVGGGLAGCVVAARLSEISEFNVALLEAGGEPPRISKIPRLALLIKESEFDWNYTTVPQKDALLNYPDQVMNLTRGKMLGGSGSLNFMEFYHGNKLDYRHWKREGARGWEWENVLRYLKKSEDSHEIDVDDEYHGHDGPICVTNPGQNNPVIKTFMESLRNLGYNKKDPNGDGTQTGYSYTPHNVCNNVRQSTYTNYLKPVLSRENLEVKRWAFVEKILFDERKRAFGVLYKKNGYHKIICAKKEVIVSGGAINSPQLLMLSGIGPRKHLESLNIKVLADLKVGDNFQDHLRVDIVYTEPYENFYTNESIEQFFEGKGPLIEFNAGNAFINTRYSTDVNNPDVQFFLLAYSLPKNVSGRLQSALTVSTSRPESRGILRLKSRDPYEYPMIDPRYLNVEQDVKVLAEGLKIGNSVLDSMNVSQHGYTKSEFSVPACDEIDKQSDEYWRCLVRNVAVTALHYCGTCRMGNRHKKTSVVDPRLNVIGVKNIRVIDASVMPTVTSANIQAAVIMIAEKGSHMIKEDYNKL